MVLMGIDPSFNHLAISIYDGKGNIYLDMVSTPLGSGMGFDKIFHSVKSQWEKLDKVMDRLYNENGIKVDCVISEVPPPVGTFSAGLFALDTYVLSNLFEKYDTIKRIYFVSPSYLGTIHGTSKYKKSDSTKLAKYYLNEVFEGKYNIIIPDNVSATGRKTKGQINNDKAESLLFLLRLFVKFNIDGRALQIQSIMSGLGYEAEKLLCERK